MVIPLNIMFCTYSRVFISIRVIPLLHHRMRLVSASFLQAASTETSSSQNAIFAIIPFMPPWRQIFSPALIIAHFSQFDNKGAIHRFASIYTNLFSHPPGIEFPAAGAAGCNLRNLFLEFWIAVPPLECVAFFATKNPAAEYFCIGVCGYLLTDSNNTIT